MVRDRKVEGIMRQIASDVGSEFSCSSVLWDSAVAVYGANSKVISNRIGLERSGTYDLDFIAVLPKRDEVHLCVVKDVFSRLAKNYTRQGLEVHSSFVQGAVKVPSEGNGQSLLLHALIHDPLTLVSNPVYFQSRMTHNHVMIYGNMPKSFYVERFGFVDVLPDVSKRISLIREREGILGKFDENAKMHLETFPLNSDQELLEAIGPYVVHNAINLLAVLHPYSVPEYPDNDLEHLNQFRQIFSGLSVRDTPLEIKNALVQARKGDKIDVRGIGDFLMHYFEKAELMVRDLIGGAEKIE